MSTISKSASSCSDEDELRRGPWTVEEDKLLIHYIGLHGEGRWNLLAKRSGLRRTGKSCRLRWLNYLKPDVKRGNLSPQEQLLILELHSKWGNRWSRIAQHLPGRTDNEIKNYWRTRVLKQARNLKIDSNSAAFHEMIRNLWIPRLLQKIQSSTAQNSPPSPQVPCSNLDHCQKNSSLGNCTSSSISSSDQSIHISEYPQISEYPISPFNAMGNNSDYNTLLEGFCSVDSMESFSLSPTQSAMGDFRDPIGDCHVAENSWNGDMEDNLWNMDELWQFR